MFSKNLINSVKKYLNTYKSQKTQKYVIWGKAKSVMKRRHQICWIWVHVRGENLLSLLTHIWNWGKKQTVFSKVRKFVRKKLSFEILQTLKTIKNTHFTSCGNESSVSVVLEEMHHAFIVCKREKKAYCITFQATQGN